MNAAMRVATGNRQRVLENGPDLMSSDDEDALEDVEPDVEKNMYTAGMDPTKGPIKLSVRQMAAQRAAAAILALQKPPEKSLSASEPERQPTPVSSDTEDQEDATEDQKRYQRLAKKKAGVAPPRPQTPVNGSSDDDGPNGPDKIWSQSRHFMRQNKNKKRVDSLLNQSPGQGQGLTHHPWIPPRGRKQKRPHRPDPRVLLWSHLRKERHRHRRRRLPKKRLQRNQLKEQRLQNQ
jgi:hypothetical protein